MATASHQTTITTVTDRAQTAIENGKRALKTVRAYLRPIALSLDVAFEAGANHRRRRLIKHLARNGRADIGELSEVIAAQEHSGETRDTISGQQRKRVYVSLYQTHIPKLDEMGIVAYDETRGSVRLTNAGEELAEWVSDATRRFGGGD